MKHKNINKCRSLRRNQTEAEKKLWLLLRNRQLNGIKFRRQFPIGGYILDFYCPEYKVGIEADGGQHYEEKGEKRDEKRTKELMELGVEIIRFSDYEILTNIEGVCEVIKRTIERKRSPLTSNPLPEGERKPFHNLNKVQDKAPSEGERKPFHNLNKVQDKVLSEGERKPFHNLNKVQDLSSKRGKGERSCYYDNNNKKK